MPHKNWALNYRVATCCEFINICFTGTKITSYSKLIVALCIVRVLLHGLHILARSVVLKITYCNYNNLDSVILHELAESFAIPSLFSSDFLLVNFINARKLSSKRNRTNKGKIPSRFCHNVHKFTEKMR